MNVLELHEINYSYNPKEVILENINLIVEEGDFLVVLGPNGGGKSTLLKLITGIIPPDSGRIALYQEKPSKKRNQIGYLPQNVNINQEFPISVQDVVLTGIVKSGMRFWIGQQYRAMAIDALKKVGMEGYAQRHMGSLSGGQRQRVLIARALMRSPSLLLLDEPTASIDVAGKNTLYELLKKLNHSMTIIMVSHDLSVIPAGVKSIACVNRRLHYHNEPNITEDMLTLAYGCTDNGECPVELVAHGVPHRVIEPHRKE